MIAPFLYIIQALALPFIPESPIWLLGHRGEKEALKALKWLRYVGKVNIIYDYSMLVVNKTGSMKMFLQSLRT